MPCSLGTGAQCLTLGTLGSGSAAPARQRWHDRRGAGRRQCSRQRAGWAGQCSGLAANCANARAPKEAQCEAMKNKKKKKKKAMYNQWQTAYTTKGKQ